MLHIFTDKITNRLNYTLSIVFESCGIVYEVMTDWSTFEGKSGAKLIYSTTQTSNIVPTIKAAHLLTEVGVNEQEVSSTKWEDAEILRFSGQPDVFSSIFYVLSLYDDFTQKSKDEHGRNKGEDALLYRLGWLPKQMVERWKKSVISFIEAGNKCSLSAAKTTYTILPTFDIDHAYAYKLRPTWRLYFTLIKDILLQQKDRIIERSEVLNENVKDPFDTFDKIQGIAENVADVKVFWLLGDYGKYDRNCSHKNKKHQALIREMDNSTSVGLHPSYASNKSIEQLKKEKTRIEEILGKKVNHCRQHFLKVNIPETFERLTSVGFTDDYSLGYADKIGFRAGTAHPFLWYNLAKDEVSNLTLHPITYMDGTLNEYLELSINEAVNYVRELKAEVKAYGGEFIPLWHNETIGDYKTWEGWSEVLKATVEEDK